MNARWRSFAVTLAILAAVALLLWLLRTDVEGGEVQGARSPSAGAAPAAAAGERPSFATEAPAPAPAAAIAIAPPGTGGPTPTTGRLLVTVTWETDGKPAPDIATVAVFWDAPEPLFNQREGLTDAAGRWELADVPPGKLGVYLDRANGGQVQVTAGETAELHLVIPAGVLVRGLVVDADEQPVPGASVWMEAGHPSAGNSVARADAAGRFTLRDMRENNEIGARADGRLPSPLVRVSDTGSHVQELTLRLGGAGAALAGRVLDAAGAPVAGALVIVGPEDGWPAPDESNRLMLSGPPARRLHSDAQGAYSAHDLPRGKTPLAARAHGHSPWIGLCDLETGATAQVDIVLPASATVTGLVSDEDGRPVAGARVSSGEYSHVDWVETQSGADGRYELLDLALGTDRVSAGIKDGGKDETKLMIGAGARLQWDPRLTHGLQIVGRVLDASEAPLPGLHVDATCYQLGRTITAQATTDARGHFTLSNCGDGESELSVYDASWKTQVASQKGVRPGPDEVVLHVIPDSRPSAFLTGRVVDSLGLVPELTSIIAADGTTGRGQSKGLDPDTGAFRCGPLVPGEWDLVVLSKGRKQFKVGRFTLVADETHDAGTITLPEPGRVLVHVTLGAGVTIDRVFCALDGKDNRSGGQMSLQPGNEPVWVSGPLDPGDYIAIVGPGSGGEDDVFVVPAQATVHVEAGHDAQVELIAERGTAVNIHLVTQRDKPPPTTVIATDAAGTEALRRSVYWNEPDAGSTQSEGYVSLVGRPGPYALKVECEGKVVVEQGISVPAGVNIGPDVKVVVP